MGVLRRKFRTVPCGKYNIPIHITSTDMFVSVPVNKKLPSVDVRVVYSHGTSVDLYSIEEQREAVSKALSRFVDNDKKYDVVVTEFSWDYPTYGDDRKTKYKGVGRMYDVASEWAREVSRYADNYTIDFTNTRFENDDVLRIKIVIGHSMGTGLSCVIAEEGGVDILYLQAPFSSVNKALVNAPILVNMAMAMSDRIYDNTKVLMALDQRVHVSIGYSDGDKEVHTPEYFKEDADTTLRFRENDGVPKSGVCSKPKCDVELDDWEDRCEQCMIVYGPTRVGHSIFLSEEEDVIIRLARHLYDLILTRVEVTPLL